jgi:hypothetical protein
VSVNKYDDHLLILPEDEANEKIANGFVLHGDVVDSHVRVLPKAGGWETVVERFEKDHIQTLRKFPKRRIVLLLDFDEKQERRECVETKIPGDLHSRVFLLGREAFRSNPRADCGRLLSRYIDNLGASAD